MKKIDAILNGVRESQKSMVIKLEIILTPFALLAVDKTPTYIGHVVRELGVKRCKDCGIFTFYIDGDDVAYVDLKRMEAFVFNGEIFSISNEDAESIKNILKALKRREGSNNDPVKDIVEGMPKELKSLLEAAVAVSRPYKGEDN